MEKADAKQKKPNKKEQYERFRETARELGIDDEESGEAFEIAFKKIIPPKRQPSTK